MDGRQEGEAAEKMQSYKANGRMKAMPSVTVRNVLDEVHRALKVLAAQHGRSAEAEVRDILANRGDEKIH